MEVDERMLGELEAMGFPKTLAEKALSSSGNSSIEDAINWLVDHDNDAAATEPPPMETEVLENINIEASRPIQISEQVKLRAQELRDQARKNRAEQEKKQDWEREKERIRAGKELLDAKRMAEERERKRYIAQREADKEEERRARQQIRQKLQQDKLERRGVLGLPSEIPPPVNTEFPQKTNNRQPVETSASPRERMRECLRSLKRRNKDDNTGATRAFETLLIYVKNVFNYPDEGKFRKIRISNPLFQERVGRLKEGVEFLEVCGFERIEGGKFLFLPRERVEFRILKSAAEELHNALTNPFFGLFSA